MTNKVFSPNRADVVGGREELAEENPAAHMHSHMLLQVLSVKEGNVVGGTLASWELHKDVKEQDAHVGIQAKGMLLHVLTPPTNSTFSMHPVDLGVMSPLFVPGPSATEDVIPLAAVTWLHKVALLQSLRRQEGKVVPNSKRPKLTYFYHLSFKKI